MFELDSSEEGLQPEALLRQCEALMETSRDRVANAANLSSLLYHALADVNWVGFYFVHDGRLLVGPFQGKPACVEIPLGRGVCGTAAASAEIQRVADVHQFAGHIACDAASESEIVVPLLRGDEVIGVLDIDSPVKNRFSQEDEAFFSRIAQVYLASID